MEKQLFDYFCDSIQNGSEDEFQQKLNAQGYSTFSKFIDGFRDAIRTYDEDQSDYMVSLVDKANQLFPKPILFSPHWQSIWEEFRHTIEYKNRLFQQIHLAERPGEWQIILDNPFTNQEIVCYPALDFIEAAYLFGYFRPDLKENEYIRLQKVQTSIVEFGFSEQKSIVSQ